MDLAQIGRAQNTMAKNGLAKKKRLAKNGQMWMAKNGLAKNGLSLMSTPPRKNPEHSHLQFQWTGRTLSLVFSSAGPFWSTLSYRFLRMGLCTADSADFFAQWPHVALITVGQFDIVDAFMLSGGASLSHFQKDMRRCL